MHRKFRFRAIAAVAGLAAGTAVPATALSHAMHHMRATATLPSSSGHSHDHEHAQESPAVPAVSPAEDHEHTRVDLSPKVKLDAWTPPPATVTILAVAAEPAATSASLDQTELPGPAPPGEPPPRLRAPPQG